MDISLFTQELIKGSALTSSCWKVGLEFVPIRNQNQLDTVVCAAFLSTWGAEAEDRELLDPCSSRLT